jgi:hypothetical protein
VQLAKIAAQVTLVLHHAEIDPNGRFFIGRLGVGSKGNEATGQGKSPR